MGVISETRFIFLIQFPLRCNKIILKYGTVEKDDAPSKVVKVGKILRSLKIQHFVT